MINSSLVLTKMSKNQFVMALSKIRYAVDSEKVMLYGIVFTVDLCYKHLYKFGSDPIVLIENDSLQSYKEESKAYYALQEEHVFEPDDRTRVLYLRSGTILHKGVAIWEHRELLIEALQSGNCNIG